MSTDLCTYKRLLGGYIVLSDIVLVLFTFSTHISVFVPERCDAFYTGM